MEQVHMFMVDKVKLGKKGQITIPKKIRDEDSLKEDDVFIVKHMPSGTIMLEKQRRKNPYDMIFEAIAMAPKFDADKAWKEVKEERKRERS
ncbi:AbrB/MazE/SpoVT family DNA-binding domain-containing protein [Candidatus Woesearchaeota archaeon]|nr:AbrB/MazE/SpoVT family DNA-binding domain-containing protein [Candidatus Woesearchaeota archaeon]